MTSLPLEPVFICDASPLILLAKIDRLSLLKSLAAEIWIPATVWSEVMVDAAVRPETARLEFLRNSVRQTEDVELERLFNLQVDLGEAGALALAASHPEACLLMDDSLGRAVAKAHGFRAIGLLGLLLRARKHKLIPTLRPVFDQLSRHNWFIAEALLKQALDSVGESN